MHTGLTLNATNAPKSDFNIFYVPAGASSKKVKYFFSSNKMELQWEYALL